MSDSNPTAQELCKLANEYTLSASDVVTRCVQAAKNAAQNSGMKEVMSAFNSHAVSDQELASASSNLEANGFKVTSNRANGWLQITLKFDVCG